MFKGKSLFRSLGAALVLAVTLMGSVSVHAQLSPQQVSQFLANPASLLSSNPDGGANLTSTIRDLLLADPATLPVILSLLANANPAQQTSLGAGLGQAAQASTGSNPSFASQIQEGLAASGSQNAIASYSATTGNTLTASTGGGGAGGTGGGFPTGGGGGNTGGGGGSGGGGGGGQITGGGNGTGGSVSPQ